MESDTCLKWRICKWLSGFEANKLGHNHYTSLLTNTVLQMSVEWVSVLDINPFQAILTIVSIWGNRVTGLEDINIPDAKWLERL